MTGATGPLHGARLRLTGEARALRVAARLLACLGGALVEDGPAGVLASEAVGRAHGRRNLPPDTSRTPGHAAPARLDTTAPASAALPASTFEVATGTLLAAAAIDARRLGRDVETSRAEAVQHVLRPLLTDDEGAIRPNPPVPVGEGAVNRDLGPDGDAAAYDRLVTSIGDDALDPELLSMRAQEWRLAVTPYRRLPQAPPPPVQFVGSERTDGGAAGHSERRTAHRPPGRGSPRSSENPVVIDMTAMWAGPLATALLSKTANVVKIEPACRVDGLRHGAPGLARWLNEGKTHAALDLRHAADRADFWDLMAGADLVVDSFSRRVMPNLGLSVAELRRVRPDILTLSLPAYGLGRPEQDWVAYGSGVHATSGLGMGPHGPWAPTVSYPDPLAGLTAHVVALAMLWGRERGWVPRHAEVSLHGAIAPLVWGARPPAPCDRSTAAVPSRASGRATAGSSPRW